jgi:hypothetical protein
MRFRAGTLSQHEHGSRIIPRSFKYPLFFLGLLVMIGGGLASIGLSLPESTEVGVIAVGFILVMLGIILE